MLDKQTRRLEKEDLTMKKSNTSKQKPENTSTQLSDSELNKLEKQALVNLYRARDRRKKLNEK
ncbi:hypothetical protein [Thiohalophilus thiocyanatoxydans]|uniref:Uncharacterized protein n=1 Tax=Thiohalophilus thiocyanatoxydans TaxID=381308 RepID=A0A4R8ISR9_9GAMM|nr:hypothetical protein [Thiohalophilus thiocyanatoxydans]TDY02420.1 hypothetical protein EDC23_0789 [Thiohalophilus thiocyanatoxydans]